MSVETSAASPPKLNNVVAPEGPSKTSFWGAAGAILRKDLRAELRTKQVFNSAAVFALLVIVVFSIAFTPTSEEARALSGGLLWVALAFAAMLALSRTFAREVPNDAMLGLQMAPISPAAIYVGKLAGNVLFLGLLQVLVLPLFGVLYNVGMWEHAAELALICFLGTWGLAAVGTTFAAIATTVRLRELMLPVLLFPIEIPLLLSLVEATTVVLGGSTDIIDAAMWMRMCFGFDVIFTILSLYLFPALLEE
jgi:heme exporter protein B